LGTKKCVGGCFCIRNREKLVNLENSKNAVKCALIKAECLERSRLGKELLFFFFFNGALKFLYDFISPQRLNLECVELAGSAKL
jgi:hypothetical protein